MTVGRERECVRIMSLHGLCVYSYAKGLGVHSKDVEVDVDGVDKSLFLSVSDSRWGWGEKWRAAASASNTSCSSRTSSYW